MYAPDKYSRKYPNERRKLPNTGITTRCYVYERSDIFGFFRIMTELCIQYSALCVIVMCLMVTMASCKTAQIQGSVATCHREGELVSVPGISSDPCITCICQMREVRCSRQTCPSNEGCHMILFDKPRDQCCEQCKGCIYKENSYRSDETWADPDDPCLIYMCQAGVVTRLIKRCHVTCRDPIIQTGYCCPICKGCYVNKVNYKEGQQFPSPIDPCSTCICQNGSTSCSRELCPVLNCIQDQQYYPIGSCCPRCKGSRHIYPPPGGKCLYQRRVHDNGSTLSPDICTQ
ncbi:hypothetical protein LSH36_291g06002 [Paralvinella palmiformis]|uniref:VWFC domain-containing protein n=1 Tax=Paralvinella palmiformis TaxID=53620 RepID=A0AAD9N1F3_9ANNE|nr:hypothetical protein LSH36_291g06002 [Paralvinella palmiformis]